MTLVAFERLSVEVWYRQHLGYTIWFIPPVEDVMYIWYCIGLYEDYIVMGVLQVMTM